VVFSYTGNGYTNTIPTSGTRGYAGISWNTTTAYKTVTITPSHLLTIADGTTEYFTVTLNYVFAGRSTSQSVNFAVKALGGYTDTSGKFAAVLAETLTATKVPGPNDNSPVDIALGKSGSLGGNYSASTA
jgi:hypothetical protein